MRRPKNGYTARQLAYATNKLGAKSPSRRQSALAVGYAPSVADKAVEKIENTEGFHNAMAKLASDNGNLALKIYSELKMRDLSKESVPTLLNAVATLAKAWEVYTPKQKTLDNDKNPLRAIILREEKIINAKVEKDL